jgi:hypothetical protein
MPSRNKEEKTIKLFFFRSLMDPTYRASHEFRQQWDEVIFKIDFDDWDDMQRKYNREGSNYELLLSWFRVGIFFEGVGVLLKRNLIDIAMIDDLLGTSIKMTWEKMGPIEIKTRARWDAPRTFDDFEYLYKTLMKYEEEHPKLAI